MRKDLDDIFEKYDKDKNGSLDRDEAKRMFKQMNSKGMSKEDLESYVDMFMIEADKNENGRVTK